MASSSNINLIYVYTGKGAGARSALSAVRALSASLPLAEVRTLSAAALLEASWISPSSSPSSSSTSATAAAAALVMPGGADLPYCADLNGRGNELIRRFVSELGGTYLGLCAGGYYGCSRVEFELESEKLRVEGERELGFFPGVALGAVVPGFRYETEAGAAATRLAWRRGRSESAGEGKAEEQEQQEHWSECLDYCNGGPVFVLRGGSSSSSSAAAAVLLPDECEVEDVAVEVLARYRGGSGGSGGDASSSSSSPAVAAAAAGGAAAVRCRVGKGVAVLCGTHPELRPAREWLRAPASGNGNNGGGEEEEEEKRSSAAGATAATTAVAATAATAEDTKVSELVSALDDPAAAAERARYWESLLDAAGLGGLRGGG